MSSRDRLLHTENNGISCASFLAACGFGKRESALPSSLPNRWPNSTQEDLNACPKRIIRVGQPQEYEFGNNFVKTSKYELYNFLPKFLLEEFNPRTKVANIYFGVVGAMQTIPAITNTNGLPSTYVPLSIVLMINGALQALEDLGRHRADNEANSSIAHVYTANTRTFVDTHWANIRVGDYVKLNSRDTIPCDVVLLSVAEKEGTPPQGICYVETKSLDGETNLKLRTAIANTIGKINFDGKGLDRIQGTLETEHPNKSIDSFSGVLDLPMMGREAIIPSNVLLRGCVLRNTEWAIGVVVNTGHDTKIMMSSRETRSKTSNLEQQASSQIKLIIVLLAVVCFTGTTGQAIWNMVNQISSFWYLDYTQSPGTAWISGFFYFFLLHATFIPVSLYVSMSISRSAQSYFMNNDLQMYYERLDCPAMVRTMTLNEELGQISHIFSDKTGTLTCNVMDYRKASINGVSYGEGITEIGKAAWKLQGKEVPARVLAGEARAKELSVPHVTFYCPTWDKDIADKKSAQYKAIDRFYRALAICHDVIPERVDGKIKLSASNPDDEALVCAAAYFGFNFCDRRDKFIVLQLREGGREEEIELLETIEFTSKRKRMSVIVRGPDGVARLYTKGADTAIFPRLRAGQDELIKKSDEHSREFSDQGLRCLLVGSASLDDTFLSDWHSRYKISKSTLVELDKRKKGLPNSIEMLEEQLEQGLELLGCTALEDKLQDFVPETIAQLAAAQIKIWVLTGDKEQTAINIAVACNLVLPPAFMDQILVNDSTAPTAEAMKTLFEKHTKAIVDDEQRTGSLPRALIIDGPSLITALNGGEIQSKLLALSNKCAAVVACRVSPDQKRQMVSLIKLGVPTARTLAVGDGANDVAMIQEAHVGVGIKGEEGVQAVNSADYAIAQFRYLGLLILKHGRWNYKRLSALICYTFYKNIMMSMGQFWFNFACGWSGEKIYVEAAIQAFNLLFTSVPILLLGGYEMDINAKSCFGFPKDYLACIRGDFFKASLFWSWIGVAILESILCSVLPWFFLTNAEPVTGELSTFWQSGALTLTVVVIVVNLKILFMQTRIYWFTLAAIALSILLWFTVMFIVDSSVRLDFDFFGVFRILTAEPLFWLSVLLISAIIVSKDIYISALDRNFNYKDYHILQELELEPLQEGMGHEGGVGVDVRRPQTSRSSPLNIQDADVV